MSLFDGKKLDIEKLVATLGEMSSRLKKLDTIESLVSQLVDKEQVTGTTKLLVDKPVEPANTALDFDNMLTAHLIFEEDCRLDVHDVDGKPHIGYGRSLVTKGLSDAELHELGYEDEDDIEEITQDQAEYLFKNDIADAVDDAKHVCEEYWQKLDDVRRVVCVSLAYNTGKLGFSKFRRMHGNCANGDWEGAAKEIKDSKAYKFGPPGLKARYERLSNAMASGDVNDLKLP